jgi:16S rRNA (cytidine1402-2'-O)-methyltransferase
VALYIVATPIGNLADLSARALETLRAADVIAAEDTRRTLKLLSAHGIEGKPLVPLHAHSTERHTAKLVERMVAGESVAYVTDAGTPGVSDPGSELVRAAVLARVRVVPIPGASAALAALSASGLESDGGFRFVGFMPRDGTARGRALAKIAGTAEPVILYEAPERAAKTLRDLCEIMPTRSACVARELTKVHEELVRGTLADLAWERDEWRGEITIVLGEWEPAARETSIDDGAIDARIDAELAAGGHAKTIAERVAAWSGRPKREIYERVVRRRK